MKGGNFKFPPFFCHLFKSLSFLKTIFNVKLFYIKNRLNRILGLTLIYII